MPPKGTCFDFRLFCTNVKKDTVNQKKICFKHFGSEDRERLYTETMHELRPDRQTEIWLFNLY